MTQDSKHHKLILLTGATGYLGSNILRALIAAGQYKIIVLKRSSSNIFRIRDCINNIICHNIDEINIEQIFLDNKIDLVLHCATDYGRKEANPAQIIEANLILPIKLLEFGKKYGVKSFINTDTILDKRVNHYSLSKKQFKDWLISYKSNLVCINVVLEHFYGAGDDKTKFASYIVDSLLKQVEKIDLTKGEQGRDFIYIDDVVSAFLKIIDHSAVLANDFYEFQVGSDQVVSIKEFVLMISDIIGNIKTFLNFGALPYRENEVMNCVVDTSAIRELGWVPKFSLAEGLKEMIKYDTINLDKKI